MGRSRAKTRRHIARQTRRSRCEHASPREVRKRERRESMPRAEFAALYFKKNVRPEAMSRRVNLCLSLRSAELAKICVICFW